jgi:hypothetical protein
MRSPELLRNYTRKLKGRCFSFAAGQVSHYTKYCTVLLCCLVSDTSDKLAGSVVDPDPYMICRLLCPLGHPDPLVTRTDPAPDPSIIKQK